MRRLFIVSMLVRALATSQTALASWAYVPLEQRVIGADVIVAGRIERMVPGFRQPRQADAEPVDAVRRAVGVFQRGEPEQ